MSKYASQRNPDDYTYHPARLFKLEWNAEPGDCFLFALDHRQASLLRIMLAVFPKYHWVWGLPSPRSDWDQDTQDLWEEISDFVQELEACLLSGCNVQDLVDQMDRIATSLESLDAKAAAFYSWNDFINDLETAFGVEHLLVTTLKGFFDLLPTFKLKADATKLIMAAFEYYFWKAPILAAITTFLGEMAVVSASLATSAGLAAAQTQIAGIAGILDAAAFLRDVAFGDKNIWDDFVKPLWDNWTSTADGGTGGDDPDNDPALNNLVNVFVEREAMANYINVNCGCGGSGCSRCGGFLTDESGFGTAIDQPAYTQPSLGEFPPSGHADWDSFLSYKCKAANALILGLAESIGVLADVGRKTFVGQTRSLIVSTVEASFSALSAGIGSLPFVGQNEAAISQTVLQWTSERMALMIDQTYGLVTQDDAQLFDDLRLSILDDRDGFVCLLYCAAGTQAARDTLLSDISDIITGFSYSGDAEDFANELIEGVVTYQWLNQLWTKDRLIDRYVDATAVDCLACVACANFVSFGTIDTDDGSTLTGSGTTSFWLSFSADENGANCGDAFDVTNIQITSGAVTPPGGINEAWRFYSVTPTPDSNGNVYNSNSVPSSATVFENVRYMLISSTTAFSLSFDYELSA